MKAMQGDVVGASDASVQLCATVRTLSRAVIRVVLLLSLTALGAWSGEALAIAKFARANGNWNAVTTWSDGSCAGVAAAAIPTAADDVTICNSRTVTVNIAGAQAGSVTIAGGATATALNLGGVGTSLTVGNVIINGSTANVTRSLAVGARTLTVTGNVTINGGATTGGAGNISQLTVTTGTIAVGGDVTLNGGAVRSIARLTATTGAGPAISIAGNLNLNGGSLANANVLASVTTGTIAVAGNLNVTGGTANTTTTTVQVGAGNFNVGGNATITGGGGGATQDALLTVSSGMITITGNLSLAATVAGTTTASITNAAGRIVVNGATGATNADTLTIGPGTFTVGNAAATFANDNAAIVATTSITTGTLNVPGNLVNAAGDAITVTGAGNINVGGNWSNSGTFTAGTGRVTFSGTAQQTLTGATTFNNLTINNAAGIVLANDITATSAAAGVVTLTSGIVTTGANTLIVPRVCDTPSIARTSGYVIGNLRLAFPTSNPARTCTYDIGDNVGYLPVTVVLTGATAGTLTGRVDNGDHPDTIANLSGIDQTRSANRFWTLGTPADTLAAYTSYTATFQFCAAACTNAERDATATVGSFIVAKGNAGAWMRPVVGARTATTIQATGITPAQGFGAFAVGEPLAGVYKGINQLIDLREVY